MHTLSTRIDDEIDLFVDIDDRWIPRRWCEECRKRTHYRFDAFGLPECLEHGEEEQEHV